MRIASFNVQNMRLRRAGGQVWMDGARDLDIPEDTGPDAVRLDPLDRWLTAAIVRDLDADVLALQEVFDRETLDYFHEHYLLGLDVAPYPSRICVPGNDGRGLDLALLSRRSVGDLRSHADLTPSALDLTGAADPDRPLFRRDCLMATISGLTLVICHFKAPYPHADATWPIRRQEAQGVRRLIERRFAADPEALWLILGDLNEPGDSSPPVEPAIAPLLGDFSVDLMQRLPTAERWTFFERDSKSRTQPDVLLASPALAQQFPRACPQLVREGMGRETQADRETRLRGVGRHRPHASDHAAVLIEFKGL
jgi:endonuclease/exonuclease/phosphatase family metal-dependent hydrolase